MEQDFRKFGANLRSLLTGFLEGELPGTPVKAQQVPAQAAPQVVWGRHVDRTMLRELYAGDGAPAKHVRGVHPPAGVDHMRLKTVDVFRIPGMGNFTVPFDGYFQVVRSEPSTDNWHTATVYVNFTELKLFGRHEQLGDIMVDLNPNVVSAGNTFPASEADDAIVKCRINVAARFHIDTLGTVLFNKTPIQLANDDVKGIPTIGESGKANLFSCPVYRQEDPNGELFGYIEELNYTVMNYAPREEVTLYRTANSFARFRELSAR